MLHRSLKIPCTILCATLVACLASCSAGKLATTGVLYQSVRSTNYVDKVPDDAKIQVEYYINGAGKIYPKVYNRTSQVMVIDKTLSFFVDPSGKSFPYYDPNVAYSSSTNFSSSTSGTSLGLGYIIPGLGISESSTSGSSSTSATYTVDQPQIGISPKSAEILKPFNILGVGSDEASDYSITYHANSALESPIRFSVCLSYSLDNGETFDQIVTDFYVNSQINEPVTQKGRVNNALRNVFTKKADAINEQWWLLHFLNNIDNTRSSRVYDTEVQGFITDYR